MFTKTHMIIRAVFMAAILCIVLASAAYCAEAGGSGTVIITTDNALQDKLQDRNAVIYMKSQEGEYTATLEAWNGYTASISLPPGNYSFEYASYDEDLRAALDGKFTVESGETTSAIATYSIGKQLGSRTVDRLLVFLKGNMWLLVLALVVMLLYKKVKDEREISH